MNAEKLRRLQSQVRIGGKGTPRRKKKVMHQSAATDDKKLQSSLKKLSVSTIPGIEEVNIIKDDLTVIHFNNPKAQASLSANTFAVTGHGESKKIVEMLPEILPQLGQDTVMQLRMFANTMSGNQSKSSNIVASGSTLENVTEEDEVPMLVNDFEEVAKIEEAKAKAMTTNENADVKTPQDMAVKDTENAAQKIDAQKVDSTPPKSDEKMDKKAKKQQNKQSANGAAKNKTESAKNESKQQKSQMKSEKSNKQETTAKVADKTLVAGPVEKQEKENTAEQKIETESKIFDTTKGEPIHVELAKSVASNVIEKPTQPNVNNENANDTKSDQTLLEDVPMPLSGLREETQVNDQKVAPAQAEPAMMPAPELKELQRDSALPLNDLKIQEGSEQTPKVLPSPTVANKDLSEPKESKTEQKPLADSSIPVEIEKPSTETQSPPQSAEQKVESAPLAATPQPHSLEGAQVKLEIQKDVPAPTKQDVPEQPKAASPKPDNLKAENKEIKELSAEPFVKSPSPQPTNLKGSSPQPKDKNLNKQAKTGGSKPQTKELNAQTTKDDQNKDAIVKGSSPQPKDVKLQKPSEDAIKQSVAKGLSPQPKGASPQPKGQSPQPKGQSPQTKGQSPQPKEVALQPKGTSPKPKGLSPQPKAASPQPKAASPQPKGPKAASPQPNTAAQPLKVESPQPKAASPQPKEPTPQPKAASPQPNATAQTLKVGSPQPKATSPQPKGPTPQPNTASPQPNEAAQPLKVGSPQPKAASPQPKAASPQPQTTPEDMKQAIAKGDSTQPKDIKVPTPSMEVKLEESILKQEEKPAQSDKQQIAPNAEANICNIPAEKDEKLSTPASPASIKIENKAETPEAGPTVAICPGGESSTSETSTIISSNLSREENKPAHNVSDNKIETQQECVATTPISQPQIPLAVIEKATAQVDEVIAAAIEVATLPIAAQHPDVSTESKTEIKSNETLQGGAEITSAATEPAATKKDSVQVKLPNVSGTKTSNQGPQTTKTAAKQVTSKPGQQQAKQASPKSMERPINAGGKSQPKPSSTPSKKPGTPPSTPPTTDANKPTTPTDTVVTKNNEVKADPQKKPANQTAPKTAAQTKTSNTTKQTNSGTKAAPNSSTNTGPKKSPSPSVQTTTDTKQTKQANSPKSPDNSAAKAKQSSPPKPDAKQSSPQKSPNNQTTPAAQTTPKNNP